MSTEHTFSSDRIVAMRKMIMRRCYVRSLAKQHATPRFRGAFYHNGRFAGTIRLLDPPLHEFLCTDDEMAVANVGLP